MISEVFRKFIDDHKSGLGIVELPTSIGKTFSTFECIAKYTQEWAEYKQTHKRNGDFRQIIVVTPLKKNLQASNKEVDELDGLERAYDRLGRVQSAVLATTVTSLLHPIYFGRALPNWRVAVRLHAVTRRCSSHVCIQESHSFRGESMSIYPMKI